ncbi:hypothetical protein E3N88_36209 [Mikania micrantha]|uniref:hAT-like transposase RNase-H fold domain-containing protein n=1 Tax=Mikania micrantha TaxID=192012 RepID=A0A5N6M341_9ASTR|nr:hypothetical protein E3N88_36209 [Mikania micrantha]
MIRSSRLSSTPFGVPKSTINNKMDSTTIHDLSSDDNQQPEKRKSEPVKKETEKKKAKTLETDLVSKGVPSSVDWFVARQFAKSLELFKQKTIKSSSTTQVTVNEFFMDIMEIDNHIRELKASGDVIQKQLSMKMEVKYEKYWRDASQCNMLLYFAAILDPRQKFHVIEFGWGLIVNAEKRNEENKADIDKKIQSILKPIRDAFELLFKEYEVLYSTETSKSASSSDQSVVQVTGGGDFFAKFQSSSGFTSYNTKSEVQNYLEDKQEACNRRSMREPTAEVGRKWTDRSGVEVEVEVDLERM